MKHFIIWLLAFLQLGYISCYKPNAQSPDNSGPFNHSPVANAGTSQTITLPINNVDLDGSASTDPDNNITNYEWEKIYGPASYIMNNSFIPQTMVTNLTEGIYHFELKVTDAGGLYSRDTVEIKVDHPNNEDTITLYNLYWNDLNECTLNIDNVLPTLPPGATFDVYLRGQNYDYSWGAWVQLSRDDAAEFSYEIVGNRLRITLGKYKYDCSSDVRREYNVRIIVH